MANVISQWFSAAWKKGRIRAILADGINEVNSHAAVRSSDIF
jgi:hypothetical protein